MSNMERNSKYSTIKCCYCAKLYFANNSNTIYMVLQYNICHAQNANNIDTYLHICTFIFIREMIKFNLITGLVH